MSHFTVLVVTDRPEQLEPALQPFHEYECTGIEDQYVEFIDESEEIEQDWEKMTMTRKTSCNITAGIGAMVKVTTPRNELFLKVSKR